MNPLTILSQMLIFPRYLRMPTFKERGRVKRNLQAGSRSRKQAEKILQRFLKTGRNTALSLPQDLCGSRANENQIHMMKWISVQRRTSPVGTKERVSFLRQVSYFESHCKCGKMTSKTNFCLNDGLSMQLENSHFSMCVISMTKVSF